MSHRPKRSLGQNFLRDPNVQARIVDAVRIDPGQTILEIGPGRGALTEGLWRRVSEAGGRLVLVELDDDLAADLANRYGTRSGVEVMHRDVLELPLDQVSPEPRSIGVVGNIPYNLTSPILFHLLAHPRPRDILVMLQREVADRILAAPGSRTYGAVTVGVRAVADVERVLNVSPGSFRPRPRVDSTVVRIEPRRPEDMTPDEEIRLRGLVRALFQWRRKQLGKTLRDHPDLGLSPVDVSATLEAAGARPTDRPETVGPEGFVKMAKHLSD